MNIHQAKRGPKSERPVSKQKTRQKHRRVITPDVAQQKEESRGGLLRVFQLSLRQKKKKKKSLSWSVCYNTPANRSEPGDRQKQRNRLAGPKPFNLLEHARRESNETHQGARGGAGCTHAMHGRSRMITDPRTPTMPGRSTSSFHRPGRHR